MYLDTKGIPSIGYGHNLRDVPISQRAADVICEDDIEATVHQVLGVIGDDVWPSIGEARQVALIDMAAMGPAKLAQFHNMIAAIRTGDWATAALEALNSQWAKDVGPDRSGEVAAMFRTGALPDWVAAALNP